MNKGKMIEWRGSPPDGRVRHRDLSIYLVPPRSLSAQKIGVTLNKDGIGEDVPGYEGKLYNWEHNPGHELMSLMDETLNSGHNVHISTNAMRLLKSYGFTFDKVD